MPDDCTAWLNNIGNEIMQTVSAVACACLYQPITAFSIKRNSGLTARYVYIIYSQLDA